jgi:hypothetical protein
MDRSMISKISQQVSRQFPEMSGVNPTVQSQKGSAKSGQCYVLTYKGKADLPGGRVMKRIVRVVVDDQGQIIRISTSK